MLDWHRLLVFPFTVAIVVALLGIGYAKQKVPVYTPPKIKMPSPNAFDYFKSAAALVKSADEVKKAFDWSVARSDLKTAIVKKNRAALVKLREGLRYKCRTPFKYGMDALYPEYGDYRMLARLVAIEAEVKASHGDWFGATSSCEDGLAMAELVGYGDSNGIGQLVGIACNGIEHSLVWDVVPHLTSAEAKAAADRMDSIRAHHYTTADSLRWEKDAQLLFLQDEFAGKYTSESKKANLPDWANMPDYIRINTYTRYTEFMDQSIRCVEQPYRSKPLFPEIKQTRNPRYAPADILLSIFCPSADSYWFAEIRSETRNRMLQAAFALQAYHADHGGYPEKLDALVPTYLKAVPDDLFALSGPLHYRRDAAKYVLWSIGPDGKDDGGQPVTDPKKAGRMRYGVQAESKGDFVAFVNN